MKGLSKSIMARSRLHNKFINNKTEENRTLFCEAEELLCLLVFQERLGKLITLIQMRKKLHIISEFWKKVRPLSSDKQTRKEKMNLSEMEKS